MGKHSSDASLQVRQTAASGVARRPQTRRRFRLPLLSIAATFGIVLVSVVDPYSGTYANAAVAPSQWGGHSIQQVDVAGGYRLKASRDFYGVTVPVKRISVSAAAAPFAGTPDPGSAKAIAKALLTSKGWGASEYNCLVSLWDRESGWNVYAANPSGAYGIPQALPGNKMASAGPNWQSNARTQIVWGLGYIQGRYKTPCGAWAQSQAAGWY
ncbi:MAG: lytic transglycosylase protein [Glaciihabitans sp.]|nr:lytic transglycosylase protein [Glaciihabitans sp.]